MSIFITYCSQNQANRPVQTDAKNQVELLLSQIAPQFLKNEFAESQNRIVTQEAPQQFNQVANNPQNIIDALTSEFQTKILKQYNVIIDVPRHLPINIWALGKTMHIN